MRIRKFCTAGAALVLAAALLAGCQKKEDAANSGSSVPVVVWTYYKGTQMDSLEKLVSEFNETVGAKKGIVVTAESKGSLEDLRDSVAAAIEKKVGSEEVPNIFSAYTDTVSGYEDQLVDLRTCFSEEELGEYVEEFLKQGGVGDGELYILPVAKSTELLYLNETDWKPFAAATGVTEKDLTTWEGIAGTAERYFEWSGGKKFFGRDAAANYMLVGAAQLGCELFERGEDGTVLFCQDEKTLRRLWDNFAVPYLRGYYGAYGNFRSDDVKTGDLLACIGSTASVSYFPAKVTKENGATYRIEAKVYPLPNFEGCEPYAVQQGAGMAVTKSDEKTEQASAEFLKWLTQVEPNTKFCVSSGYFPVKKDANTKENMDFAMRNAQVTENDIRYENALVGMDQISNSVLYIQKAYISGDNRSALERCLTVLLDEYREEYTKVPEKDQDEWLEAKFEDWCRWLEQNID